MAEVVAEATEREYAAGELMPVHTRRIARISFQVSGQPFAVECEWKSYEEIVDFLSWRNDALAAVSKQRMMVYELVAFGLADELTEEQKARLKELQAMDRDEAPGPDMVRVRNARKEYELLVLAVEDEDTGERWEGDDLPPAPLMGEAIAQARDFTTRSLLREESPSTASSNGTQTAMREASAASRQNPMG